MIKRILFLTLATTMTVYAFAQEKKLVQGMKLTKSAKIKKANYTLRSSDISKPVMIIEGKNIVVDFNNAMITGSLNEERPDSFSGVFLLVRNSKKVTIKNLRARGFKIAIRAERVDDLVIQDCDLSYNYRKNLNSTQEKEDISDWMSYHQNEKDEWLRYGAGIYLKNCNRFQVLNCRITGGQNALMLSGCHEGMIMHNDFSFNSGIGIGMYRSMRNKVFRNRLVFNVRGYSHGVYNRGQDSAGILVYEQSSDNIFYGNNATHCGDGFFLWAGQSTMDNGRGGCNNNYIGHNDFSYAPTNGIEVTFSSNRISYNRLFECDYGIWGGYSWSTTIEGNQFRDNRIGLAIEHGQQNLVIENLFSGDKTAIRIWANERQAPDWGYPKYRDTRSAGYEFALNSFNNNQTVFNISRTDSIFIHDNTFNGFDHVFRTDSTVGFIDSSLHDQVKGSGASAVRANTHGPDPFRDSGKFRGRKNIFITEWGPYDFQYPLIWHLNPVDSSSEMKFVLLGPPGKWRVRDSKGVTGLSKRNGNFPDTIFAQREEGTRTDISIELEYTGPAFTDAFGRTVSANKPHPFSFKKFFQPVDWQVLWYSMDTAFHNPITTGELFSPVERKRPVREESTNKLDYAWWGGIKAEGETFQQFFTVADGAAEFAAGEYEFSVTWDDAVRMYVDGNLVLNEWNPSLYKFDESPNKKFRLKLGGKHNFRVEHVELGGFACLSLKIKKLR